MCFLFRSGCGFFTDWCVSVSKLITYEIRCKTRLKKNVLEKKYSYLCAARGAIWVGQARLGSEDEDFNL